MKHPAIRLSRGFAVVVAGITAGLTTTYAVAATIDEVGPGTPLPVDQSPVADWAADHQLSGLSPASVGANALTAPGEPIDHDEINKALAQFAREHGLTGLSPASLHPIDD